MLRSCSVVIADGCFRITHVMLTYAALFDRTTHVVAERDSGAHAIALMIFATPAALPP